MLARSSIAACAFVLIVPRQADACSRALCYGPVAWSDAGVPSTTPAIPFHPPSLFYSLSDASTVLMQDGAVVPTTIEREGIELVLRPGAPLAEGAYEIQPDPAIVRRDCYDDAGTVPIRITAGSMPPASLGSLRLLRRGPSTNEHQTGCDGFSLSVGSISRSISRRKLRRLHRPSGSRPV